MVGTLTIEGKEYAVIPVDEYERLRESLMPPLPEADEQGRRPAREAIRVSVARTIIRKRLEVDMSREALAAAAGVELAELEAIESGKVRSNPESLDRIDAALVAAGATFE